jgi:hypothetical protein
MVRYFDASIRHIYIRISRVSHARIALPATEQKDKKIIYQQRTSFCLWLAECRGWLKVGSTSVAAVPFIILDKPASASYS